MLYKLYLSEDEFDKLNYAEQKDFFYCTHCKHYYYYKELKGGCQHEGMLLKRIETKVVDNKPKH